MTRSQGDDELDSSISHLVLMPDPHFSALDLTPQASQPERASSLISVAIVLLQQGVRLLKETVRTDEQFAHSSTNLPGSSIGKHLRHILDHYRLLLDALESEVCNYDSRERDVPLETRRDVALGALRGLMQRFETDRDRISLHRPLRLVALTPEAQEFHTTFGRELWFASLHTIHHYSLIRVIIVGELGLDVPADFGVAPSTLAFRAWSQEDRFRDQQKTVKARL